MHTAVTIVAKYFVAIPVVVLACVFLKLNRRQRVQLIIFLAVSTVITAALVKIAAAVHQDPRPFVRDHVTPYFASSTDNGFPSDHTTFSAVIAFVVLAYRRRLGAALAILALVIGSARVIAGVHHGQDIIGGFLIAALGSAAGWYLGRLAEPLVIRYLRACLPAAEHDKQR